MSYSMKEYPFKGAKPEDFPKPPMWMVHSSTWRSPHTLGQVRHHESLEKAKKNLSWLYRGDYHYDTMTSKYIRNTPVGSRGRWRIYEWVDGAWVLRYSGEPGEPKSDNPLFVKRKRVSRKPAQDHEVEAAIASIQAAL